MELETSDLTLQGLHFPNSRPVFQLRQVGISQETLTRCLLIGGCGQSTYLLSMAEIISGSSLSLTSRENRSGVRLRVVESENDLEKKI